MKTNEKIPVFKPHIGSETVKAAVEALDLGWLGMGSYVRSFEEKLTEFLELESGRKLVAVNTCTSALHLALRLAGVGPNDEVITPSLNNIGDFQAIGMCGAKPVFVDICEDNLGINPELIESAITAKTKAIIALHYMGLPCRIDEVYAIAKRRGIRVIEDAAHATGTKHNGKYIGATGDLCCFSFDAIKTLTCIDGGAVVVNSQQEADQVYPERLLGMTQSNDKLYSNSRAYRYDVHKQGFRYHLANLHASIGLSQLEKLQVFISNRQKYCRYYNKGLAGLETIITPPCPLDNASIFHYVIRVRNGLRNHLMEYLSNKGIDSGVHWIPGHLLSCYRNERGAECLPVTESVGSEILTLPLWSFMETEVLERVVTAVRGFRS